MTRVGIVRWAVAFVLILLALPVGLTVRTATGNGQTLAAIILIVAGVIVALWQERTEP